MIDYNRGKQCLFPTHKQYWKPFKEISRKHQRERVYFTRYMSNYGMNYLANTKGLLWYDWDKKCYKPKSDRYNGKDVGNCPLRYQGEPLTCFVVTAVN